MHLQSLHVYPIKGLAGISLTEARLTPKGILHDRRWMLVNDQARFLSQREFPQMALGQISITDNELVISAKDRPDLGSISVGLFPEKAPLLRVMIWDDEVDAQQVSAAADAWFSQWLGIACRLVYMPDDSPRPLDPRYPVTVGDDVSFADGYPFLLICQSTVDDLNQRLDQPLPMNRFRPNLVVAGGDPYAEDTWADFQIGNASFLGVKPCGRCTVTTVDQETAEKGQEPLRTLTSYRKAGNKVLFGQNVVLTAGEWIRIGDPVVIHTYSLPPSLNQG